MNKKLIILCATIFSVVIITSGCSNSLKDENIKLTKEVSSMKEKNSELEKSLEELKEEIKNKNNTIENLRNSVDSLIAENVKLKKQLENERTYRQND